MKTSQKKDGETSSPLQGWGCALLPTTSIKDGCNRTAVAAKVRQTFY
jgi:hypothetical protein